MSAGRLRRSASIILSRLTANMPSGVPSTIPIGRRSISSQRRAVSPTTTARERAHSTVRRPHVGEGRNDQAEMVIQRLLIEAGTSGIGDELVVVDARGFEVP